MKLYRLGAIIRRPLLECASPFTSGLLATCVYVSLAGLHGTPWRTSGHEYFNYLADAFLHGQLNLRVLPPATHDLVLYAGRYYLYWPPFPAVVLMPFVSVFGLTFSDVMFTAVLGGVDVGLVGLLLAQATQRGILRLTDIQRALLTVFFAFGTVLITLAPFGAVWCTAQLLGVGFVLLTYVSAISLPGGSAVVCAGLALACAAATRNHLVFAGIWPGLYLWHEHAAKPRGVLLGWALAGTAPVVTAVVLLALYNWARFGDPFNVGIRYHLAAPFFRENFHRYGAFDIHYVLTNLYYQHIYYPFPIRADFYMGGSLWLLSPVFLAAFWGMASDAPRWSRLGLIASILAVNVPILLLMGTGWMQFGPRYTLDFVVPLILLTGMGLPKWRDGVTGVAVLISIVQYAIGTAILIRAAV
ncbi:MAG TPA: hypothetical protein VL049_13785 [Candidatus Dormibacteraeota bacterium]|nr:hypothetical protein [Candidatus Dormibacteraeota bacterium]